MKTVVNAFRTTFHVLNRTFTSVVVGLVALSTVVLFAPPHAWAENRITLVSCTSMYPGRDAWEIIVEMEADKPNLDRKWLGASINIAGRWVDLDYFYVVSPQENSDLHKSRANGLKRRMTWVVEFDSRARPQAASRAVPTFGPRAPSGYGANPRHNVMSSSGQPWLDALKVSLHLNRPFHVGYHYSVALWEGGDTLARVSPTGCP